LDTRTKIVLPETLPAREVSAKIVIGYFDPLAPANVDRLQEISGGERLTVIVADRRDAILPLRARTELVASLACVEYVVPCADCASDLARRLGDTGIIDEREADERRARELSAHILERYRPE
jgi:hypothetical protein